MTLTVGTASGNRQATDLYVGTAAGTKAVTEGWIGTASGNQQFYGAVGPLSVIASPDNLSWENVGGAYYSAQDAICSASGGVGPYAYSWSIDSPGSSVNEPTNSQTGFQSLDGSASTITCTVTDALGAVVVSNSIFIS